MKLIKGKKIKAPKHSDIYKFTLDFMIGDADGYEKVVLFISPNNPNLERFLRFLDKCKKAYPYGRGGRDTYDHIEDFDFFCDEDECGDAQCYFNWPCEPYSDCQTSFESFKITYFDADGVEYAVDIKES